MSTSHKNKLYFLTLIIVVLIVLVVSQSNFKNPSQLQTQTSDSNVVVWPAQKTSMQVTFEHNMMRPSLVQTTQHQTKILAIHAVDRDYTFNIKDFGVVLHIPKGKTILAELYGEAVGEHEIVCGDFCRGEVYILDTPEDGEGEE